MNKNDKQSNEKQFQSDLNLIQQYELLWYQKQTSGYEVLKSLRMEIVNLNQESEEIDPEIAKQQNQQTLKKCEQFYILIRKVIQSQEDILDWFQDMHIEQMKRIDYEQSTEIIDKQIQKLNEFIQTYELMIQKNESLIRQITYEAPENQIIIALAEWKENNNPSIVAEAESQAKKLKQEKKNQIQNNKHKK